jgi:phosphatidylinositol alpha-1,6-mannosyltransferase
MDKSTQILFLTDYFLPHAGGARVYYFNLYRNLINQFPDRVTVLTKKVDGWEEFDRMESSDSFRIVRHFKPLSTWKYHELPKLVFPLMEAMYRSVGPKFDVVHFGDLYPQGAISLLLKTWFGIPYLAYCHGEEITLTDRFRYQPTLRNKIYRAADAVVAANSFAREQLKRIGVSEHRIHTITPGVNCDVFRPNADAEEIRRRYQLDGKMVLLSVGRLCKRKNHSATLHAIRKILSDLPNLVFLIIGRGESEQKLRQLVAEQKLDDVVRFIGYVPDEKLPNFYAAADLFVMPNREEGNGDIEGFGMVFLEANACGKAVVGGRSGGTEESVVHGVTGMLVNPDDIDELAATLKLLLLNQDLRHRMGNAGLRRARSEYSWAERGRMLHDISANICGAKAVSCAKIDA